MKKRYVLLSVLVLLMTVVLCACGDDKESNGTTSHSSSESGSYSYAYRKSTAGLLPAYLPVPQFSYRWAASSEFTSIVDIMDIIHNS